MNIPVELYEKIAGYIVDIRPFLLSCQQALAALSGCHDHKFWLARGIARVALAVPHLYEFCAADIHNHVASGNVGLVKYFSENKYYLRDAPRGNAEMLRHLLQNSMFVCSDTVNRICEDDDVALIKVLIDDSHYSYRKLCKFMVINQAINCMTYALEKIDGTYEIGRYLMYYASKNRYEHVIEFLITRVDPNIDDNVALRYAVLYADTELITKLLAAGAGVGKMWDLLKN